MGNLAQYMATSQTVRSTKRRPAARLECWLVDHLPELILAGLASLTAVLLLVVVHLAGETGELLRRCAGQ